MNELPTIASKPYKNDYSFFDWISPGEDGTSKEYGFKVIEHALEILKSKKNKKKIGFHVDFGEGKGILCQVKWLDDNGDFQTKPINLPKESKHE